METVPEVYNWPCFELVRQDMLPVPSSSQMATTKLDFNFWKRLYDSDSRSKEIYFGAQNLQIV